MKEQGFYFRPVYCKAAAALEGKDRLAFYDALCDFWFFDNAPPLPSAALAAFVLASQMITEDAQEDA